MQVAVRSGRRRWAVRGTSTEQGSRDKVEQLWDMFSYQNAHEVLMLLSTVRVVHAARDLGSTH